MQSHTNFTRRTVLFLAANPMEKGSRRFSACPILLPVTEATVTEAHVTEAPVTETHIKWSLATEGTVKEAHVTDV